MLDRFVLLVPILLATSSNQSSEWTPAAQDIFVELVEKAIIWIFISDDLPNLLSCWNYIQGIGESDCEEGDQGCCSKGYEYLSRCITRSARRSRQIVGSYESDESDVPLYLLCQDQLALEQSDDPL